MGQSSPGGKYNHFFPSDKGESSPVRSSQPVLYSINGRFACQTKANLKDDPQTKKYTRDRREYKLHKKIPQLALPTAVHIPKSEHQPMPPTHPLPTHTSVPMLVTPQPQKLRSKTVFCWRWKKVEQGGAGYNVFCWC